MNLHCPRCGTELEVEPQLDKLEMYSSTTLVVTWADTNVHHTCPDPTQDTPLHFHAGVMAG